MFPIEPRSGNAGGDESRQALLDAATRVFLAEGYQAARIKQIAELAGLGLSAINYHFGGKSGLYLAVLRHHAELALSRAPLTSSGTDLAPKERLRWLVNGLVSRMLDDRSPCRIGQLMLRELVNPTSALEVMVEQFSRPQFEQIRGLLAEILGPAVPSEVTARAMLSLLGQCMVYVTARPLVTRLTPGLYPDDADTLASLVDQITEFSWAGLQALRRQHEGVAP